jgi:peptidoglycan hydrolase CwlO-like protein
MNPSTTTLTISSIFVIVSFALTVFSFYRKSKQDMQDENSDYTTLKNKVTEQGGIIKTLEIDIKELEKEVRLENRRIEGQLFKEVKDVSSKIDGLTALILKMK